MKVKYLLITSLIITVYAIIIPTTCFAAHIIDEAWQPNFYRMQAQN